MARAAEARAIAKPPSPRPPPLPADAVTPPENTFCLRHMLGDNLFLQSGGRGDLPEFFPQDELLARNV
ncbi:MAG: hypothetical protein WDM76_19085 [Limisphaerales bacterium]